MLFDPRVHEPLTDVAWNEKAVREAIRDIARDADGALRTEDWWPWHPLDSDGETPDAMHGIYLGAAGVLLALQRLAEAGLHQSGHDYARLAIDALESYRRRPEFGGPVPSMWMGESGIALVAWLLSPTDALANRLAELVVVDPQHDTLELMWGSPGLLLVADAMLARTGEEQWAIAWRSVAEHLLERWSAEEPGVWTQHLYDQVDVYLGPAHGFAGIVAASVAVAPGAPWHHWVRMPRGSWSGRPSAGAQLARSPSRTAFAASVAVAPGASRSGASSSGRRARAATMPAKPCAGPRYTSTWS